MFNYIIKKLKKRKIRTTFQEYGYHVDKFNLPEEGEMQFAQWLHPFDKPKTIEQSHVDFYRQFVKKGDLVIDIGAHTGDTTVPMAFAAGKDGKVIAIEPNQYVFKILKANSGLNPDKGNIIPFNFAVTQEEGTFTFNYSDASFCNGGFLTEIENQKHNHKYTLEVEGKNLERFLKQSFPDEIGKLAFIKIDAEGYDKEIIKSIKNLLNDFRPVIITECYKRLTRQERDDFFETVKSIHYTPYHLSSFSGEEKIKINNKDEMMNWKHFDMLLLPE